MEATKQKGRLKAALIRKGTVVTFILHGNLQKIILIYISGVLTSSKSSLPL